MIGSDQRGEVPADKPTLRTRLLVWASVVVAMGALILAVGILMTMALVGQSSPDL